jgi:hypothetical protein
MAIRDTLQEEKLHLIIDNGDLVKLDQALAKWSFKDYQSLIRFSVSLLLLTEDKSISIKMKGAQTEIQPAADLLNEEVQHG